LSSPTKIIAAFIQLLSEDWRTDRRTDMIKLRYAAFNLIIQTVLNVTVTLVHYFIAVIWQPMVWHSIPTFPTHTHTHTSNCIYHCNPNMTHTHTSITIPTCPTITHLSPSQMPQTHTSITIPTCPTLTHLSSSQHAPNSHIYHHPNMPHTHTSITIAIQQLTVTLHETIKILCYIFRRELIMYLIVIKSWNEKRI